MNEPAVTRRKYDIKKPFSLLNKEESWKLQAERQIADSTYTNEAQNDYLKANTLTTSPQRGHTEFTRNAFSNDINDDVRQGSTSIAKESSEDKHLEIANNAAMHAELLKAQNDLKARVDRFFQREDYLRLVDFGDEFSEAIKYNSKKKVADNFGFEYSVPPKQLAIQNRIVNRYQYWNEKDKLLEEEELRIEHELEKPDEFFKISELVYEDPYVNSESFENYYWMIKDWRHKEHKHEQAFLNTPDTALIVDGNVAFGKTLASSDADDNPVFERKISASSLAEIEEADLGISKSGSTTLKRFTGFAKKIARRKSSSLESESAERSNSKTQVFGDGRTISNDDYKSRSSSSISKTHRSLLQRIGDGRSTLKRMAVMRRR